MNAPSSTVSVTVRIPSDLHQRLVALAERDDRSLNQQMIRLLRYAAEVSEKTPI